MKIVFRTKINRFWLEGIEALRREFSDVDFVTDEKIIEREMENADALVAGEVTISILEGARNLKIIFVPYAGVDALPLNYIKEMGIRVASVHVNAPFVAERAIAMALSFYGKIISYHDDLKNFKWHGYWAKGTMDDTWDSIQGRRCAVIGTGEIGKCIAKYLKIFDCPVIGFKKKPVTGESEYFDEITLDLNKALEKSELVFISLPLTEETDGMFTPEILAGMKDKFLVNVGRGRIVDEEGLYRALKEGVLKGAAIDTWYNYPKRGEITARPSKYPIHELPNVILSPHLAGFTPQASLLNVEQTVENIRSYISTGKALIEVDPELMY
jgi:phosphoglycerate dehydrogenase-like enzyme